MSEDTEAFMRHVEAYLAIQAKNPLDLAALKAQDLQVRLDSGEEPVFGDGRQDYMMTRYKNLALINISGSLVNSDSYYNRYYDEVSYSEIRRSVLLALSDPEIDGIVNLMNTPGGSAQGADSMASFFSKSAKTKALYTFVESEMCSGGYYLGAPSHEIYSQRAAQIGSIGVIMVHFDRLKMYQEAGIIPTVFRAGEFKALGSSVEHLTKEATAKIESMLQDYYSMFLNHVVDNRDYSSVEQLKSTAAEGRVFFAEEAMEVGLVDVVADFEEALEEMSEKAVKNAGKRANFAVNQYTQSRGSVMSKKAQAAAASGTPLTAEQIAALASGAVVEAALSADEPAGDEAEAEAEAEASAESAAAEAAAEAEAEPAAAAVAAVQGVSLVDNTDRLIALSTELGSVKAELAAAKLTEKSLREEVLAKDTVLAQASSVITQSVTNLQVALGFQPSVNEGMSAGQLIEMHNKLRTDFTERYKPGAKAQATRSPVAAVSNSPVANASRELTKI